MKTQEMQDLVKPRLEDRKAKRLIPLGLDAKKAVKLNYKYNDEKRKILRKDRIVLEIITDTRHFKLGKIIQPSVAVGETLIDAKTAKKITLKADELVRNGRIVKAKKKKSKDKE